MTPGGVCFCLGCAVLRRRSRGAPLKGLRGGSGSNVLNGPPWRQHLELSSMRSGSMAGSISAGAGRVGGTRCRRCSAAAPAMKAVQMGSVGIRSWTRNSSATCTAGAPRSGSAWPPDWPGWTTAL